MKCNETGESVRWCITQHLVLREPGWQIISCCVVGNHTRQDNCWRKILRNSVNLLYNNTATNTLKSLTVTIKEGNVAFKQYVFVFQSNSGKPQHCWRLEAKANAVIHPERLAVSFWTFPYRSHHPTRKGQRWNFPVFTTRFNDESALWVPATAEWADRTKTTS